MCTTTLGQECTTTFTKSTEYILMNNNESKQIYTLSLSPITMKMNKACSRKVDLFIRKSRPKIR